MIVQWDEVAQSERPIAYASRKLRGAELNYPTTHKECLAVVFGVEQFRQYVEGYHFKIQTDHSALIWLFNQQNLSGRLARWVMKLSEFDFELMHVKGKNNVVPDALSRIPETALIEVDTSSVDPWYKSLHQKILSSPARYKNYKINGNEIFVKSNSPTGPPFRLVLPPSLRHRALKESHDDPKAAHMGAFKTKKRLLEKYYWPGLACDVEKYVKNCDVCTRAKASNKSPYGSMGKMKKSS